jgi:putative methionine-R-sulfoxide reductase with GAF domain
MQWNYRKLSTIFTLMFIAGIMLAAYWLYKLPDALLHRTQVVDLIKLVQVKPILLELNLVTGAVLTSGLLAIIFHILNNRSGSGSNIVYVESFGKTKEGKENASEDENKQAETSLIGIEELLSSKKKIETVFEEALSLICKELEASQAAAYIVKKKGNTRFIELFASFAYHVPEGETVIFKFGEGLAGQVAKEGKLVNLQSVPEGYIQILSGLGNSSPTNLIIIPIRSEGQIRGVVEIASFKEFTEKHEVLLQGTFDKLALKLANNDNVSLKTAKE